MTKHESGKNAAAVFTVALAVVIVAGCGRETTTEAGQAPAAPATETVQTTAATAEHTPEPSELVGVWVLRDLGGRGVIDATETTLSLDAEGRASGSAGCNRYTGKYTFVDGVLSFGPLAATKMMCPEEIMTQEDGFLEGLGAVDRVAIDGPELLIWVAGSEEPLRFARIESEIEPEE